MFGLLAIFDPDTVDVHIFWFALLGVYRFDLFLELDKGLIVLAESIIDVASQPVTITCVAGVVISIRGCLLAFVDVVERFVGRLGLASFL